MLFKYYGPIQAGEGDCAKAAKGQVSMLMCSAMTRFQPQDSLYPVLVALHDQAVQLANRKAELDVEPQEQAQNRLHASVCAFCGTRCGNGLRKCAEQNGGRKALKALIRKLADEGKGAPASDRLEQLYEIYEGVSAIQRVSLVLV